mmetsp:Transcript_14124/g.37910  ORF Transcript_14124/g.37910 Transcript_14124/m.37910 type:complete len:643 (+) Transcript_14124:474-2402(+)
MAKNRDDSKHSAARRKRAVKDIAVDGGIEVADVAETAGATALAENEQHETILSTRAAKGVWMMAALLTLTAITGLSWYFAAMSMQYGALSPAQMQRIETFVRTTDVLALPPEAQRQLAAEFLGEHANEPQFLAQPVPEVPSGSVISDVAADEITCYITTRNEVMCVVQPLCIDHGALVVIDAQRKRCVHLANTGDARESVDTQACKNLVRRFFAEAELDGMRTELKRASWFNTALTAGIAHVFPMDVALMQLKHSNNNIAHFAGRVMYLQHLISYGPQLMGVHLDAVLLRMGETVWNTSFAYHLDSWQQGALRMVTYPLPLYIEPISESSPLENLGRRGIQLIPDGLGFPRATVCYRKAALPAFLKGRFFIPDNEVLDPSGARAVRWDGRGIAHLTGSEGSNGSAAQSALNMRTPLGALDPVAMRSEVELARSNYHAAKFEPTDAHVMRIKWSLALRLARNNNPFELVYLARYGRRAFSVLSERRFERMLREVASANRLQYRKVVFAAEPSFRDQMLAIQHSIVAIGLHGANLVNAALLDSRATLVEIFPFGFEHNMYREGGGSGIGYYSHQLMAGREFRALRLFADRRECMSRDVDCKVWYRSDYRRVSVSARDLIALRATVLSAIAYSRDRMLESVLPKL